MVRLGYLAAGYSRNAQHAIQAFHQGLHDLGYVEGQSIATEYRFADNNYDRLPDLATELVRLKVDIIVAAPTLAAVAAKNATETIPIVMVSASDPVRVGLVSSLAHPGGNVTGLSHSVGTEIFVKGLEVLKEAVPSLSSVAVLSNPANPAHALVARDVEVAARSLGLQFHLFQARGSDEFDAAFTAMVKAGAGALLVVGDEVFAIDATRVAELAIKHQLPSIHQLRSRVDAGGFISYGPNPIDQFRRAATFVDKVLKGAKPADLPVQQPTKFDLVINLKTATALNLTIPPTLLARADEVIE
jgi:putative ABC transport system substrate-binding protein